MTLSERLAEIKDEKAFIAVVVGNIRIVNSKKELEKDLDEKYKDLGWKDMEIDFESPGSAYAQEPVTFSFRLKSDEDKSEGETSAP